ncbi:MAG: hypothetical protein IJC61_02650 [Oscillospiraceae bacterium]|nr:hypothetical protein [Oscillospiraceae bacterium]
MAVCNKCGAPLDFVRTKRGKYMPCDVGGFLYTRDDVDGIIILDDLSGELVRGVPGAGELTGHMPHFMKCRKRQQKE